MKTTSILGAGVLVAGACFGLLSQLQAQVTISHFTTVPEGYLGWDKTDPANSITMRKVSASIVEIKDTQVDNWGMAAYNLGSVDISKANAGKAPTSLLVTARKGTDNSANQGLWLGLVDNDGTLALWEFKASSFTTSMATTALDINSQRTITSGGDNLLDLTRITELQIWRNQNNYLFSNYGQPDGDGTASGTFHYYVDSVVVPEPQTYAMLSGLGLVAFAGFRRWKNS